MAAFDYVAVDAAGRTVSGAVTASDEAAARGWLTKRRLMPLELTPARIAPRAERTGGAGRGDRLNAKTLALPTRQLAATFPDRRLVERAWRDIHAMSHHITLNWNIVSTMCGQHLLGLNPQGHF